MAQFIRYPYMGREMWEWNIEEFCGYKPISTYYTDFGIAEWYGKQSVRETFGRAIENWGTDIKWMTEIVMALNWKQFEWHYRGNDDWVKFYYELWEEAEKYVFEHFDGEDLSYFYRTTD